MSDPSDTPPARPRLPRLDIPIHPDLNAVVEAVRARHTVADEDFDAIYPPWARVRSSRFWTPLAVGRRAAELLVLDEHTRVLDVGSGAGKFCLTGALTTEGTFVGIEQRPYLVEMARTIATLYGVARADYVFGDITDIDWRTFDAFYFFNPFAENYFDALDRLDSHVELTVERFERDLRIVLERLDEAAVGTRAATYHGLGRHLPRSYERIACEACGTDVLEVWVKVDG